MELLDFLARVVLQDLLDRLEFREELVRLVVLETRDRLAHLVRGGIPVLAEVLEPLDRLEIQV